jgi:glycosyltransferase involved in cell wall biosynthesis
MKVLHFDLAHEFRGGQRQALMLHRHLLREGVDSRLLVDADGGLARAASDAGIPGVLPLSIRHRGPPAVARLRTAPAVAAILRDLAPDIVQFHEPASMIYWPLVRSALRVQTRRVSFPIKRSSVRLKYRPMHLHVGVSQEISDYLASLGLAPVTTIHSGIDLERFRRVPPARPLAGAPGFKLLYVGAFHKMKGIEVLGAAFVQLAAEHQDLVLHLVGAGDRLEGLLQTAAVHSLGHRVHVHGFRPDTESFLADADLVVVPSTYGEGSNGAIKEAMAAGRSVIASDLAGHRELVAHGRDGLLFANGSAADLANRIREVRSGRWPLEGAAIRASVERWGEARMGQAYLDLYRSHLPPSR